jgi:hypothetical protein
MSALHQVCRDARAVLSRRRDELAALALRDPAPDVVCGQREADRTGAAGEKAKRTRHVLILAHAEDP